MKKTFTLFFIALFSSVMFAQTTDVTDQLITNPTFEPNASGTTPAPWGFFANAGQNAAGTLTSENGAAKIVLSSPANGIAGVTLSSNYGNYVTSDVLDLSGREVTVSVKAKAANGNGTFQFQLKFDNGSTNWNKIPGVHNLTTEYVTYSSTYTFPENVIGVSYMLIFGAVADTYYFDDASAVVTGILSISDNLLKEDISVYPNPARDVVNIKTNRQISNVDVYDLVGRKQAVVLSEGTINIGSLNSGIYILSVKLENGASLHKKITKL